MLNSVKSHLLLYSRVLLLVFGAVLTSCGGGGDGSSSTSTTVSGTAATGAAIVGTVSVYGSNGGSVPDVPIDTSGHYTADVTGLTAPYLLLAVPSDTNLAAQYSFAAGPGTANITPMTSLVMAIANGNKNPEMLITTWQVNQAVIAMKLPAAQKTVNSNFAGVFLAIDPELNTDFSTYNIFSDELVIGDPLDRALDITDIDVSNGVPAIIINGQAFAFDSNIGTGGAGGGTNAVGGGAGGGVAGATGTLAITGEGASQLPVTSLSFIFVSISQPTFIAPDIDEQSWADAAGTSVTIAFNPQNQVIAVAVESNEGANKWGVVDVSGSGFANVSFDGNTASFVGITLKPDSAGDSTQDLVINGTLSN